MKNKVLILFGKTFNINNAQQFINYCFFINKSAHPNKKYNLFL
ncbi:hypothetical protein [Tissierella sp.]|nr:hypothetical protein [Tissierella sp.]